MSFTFGSLHQSLLFISYTVLTIQINCLYSLIWNISYYKSQFITALVVTENHPFHISNTEDHTMDDDKENECLVGRDTITNFVKSLLDSFHAIVPNSSIPSFNNYCWYSSSINLKAMPPLITYRDTIHKQMTDKEMSDAYTLFSQAIKEQENGEEERRLICLPGLFLAGFPKSGSTQLFSLITKHSLIQKGRTKECHWWTRFPFVFEHPFGELAVLAYLKHFEKAGECSSKDEKCIAVDGSQSLIWGRTEQKDDFCSLPYLVHAVNPQSKFLIAVRNPVDRLYSEYWFFSKTHGYHSANAEHFHKCASKAISFFNECLDKGSTLIECIENSRSDDAKSGDCRGLVRIQIGIYYGHIRRWLKFFPYNQFLFVRLEDMAADPRTTLHHIGKFLGISETGFKLDESDLANPKLQNSYPPMLQETASLLQDFYQPFNQKLAKLLNDERFQWNDSD